MCGHEFDIGDVVKVISTENLKKYDEVEAKGSNGCWFLSIDEFEFFGNYANSNRYKLKESLYSTGFNATDLSIASGDIKFSSDIFNSVIDNTFFERLSGKNHKITIVNNVTKDYRYAVACIVYIFTVIIGFICFMSWLAVK